MKHPARHVALLAMAALALCAALPAEAVEPAVEDLWVLAFDYDTPQRLYLEAAPGEFTHFWYMVYRVKNPDPNDPRGGGKNPTNEPLPAAIQVRMVLSIKSERTEYEDVRDVVAERHIEEKILERPLFNWSEMAHQALKPGESREGVAIFRIGPKAADFAQMALAVRGLAARTPLGREGNAQRFRERVLRIRYNYVESRWTETKELRHAGESWDIVTTTLPDRDDSRQQAIEKSIQRLHDTIKKLHQERQRGTGAAPRAPRKTSARPAPPQIARVAAGSGRRDPELLARLRAKADESRCTRAAFTEVIGSGSRRLTATGTIRARSDKCFAIERTIQLGGPRGFNERRVFDGNVLWVHTITKEIGESVRKWAADRTKKPWRTLEGRPEVDFATVVNPVAAWRLLGDDLVRMGAERLEGGMAYVLDVRPGERYTPILASPLVGQLLGRAAGGRIRFWIGADSGFQLRMRVYDVHHQVVGSLGCTEVERHAHVAPARFAFTPPPGVEVTDMTAAIAATGKDPEPK